MTANRYSITHVDADRVRRRLVIGAPSRKLAEAFAVQLYGDAWYLSAVKV
nr:hypothetical protein [Comamonas testosteroni]